MPTFLTASQASRIAHTTRVTIIRWIVEGKLRATRPGKSYLIKQEDLLALLDAVVPAKAAVHS